MTVHRRTIRDAARVATASRNPLSVKMIDALANALAHLGTKATSGTRTPDLSFTKAPLYRLS